MVVLALSWSGPGVDCYIVHVDRYAPFVDQVAEYRVHHSLERCRRVGEPEEHDCWFVESLVGDERRFPSILRFDEHFIVPPLDVDTGELCAVAQSVDQGGYKGKGVAVFNRPGVYWSVVLDRSEFSVFLFDEEEGRGVGAFRWLDGSAGGVFFEELGELPLFGSGEVDGFADESCWGPGF